MTSDDNSDIARRTVSGSLYSIGSSAITLGLGFVRAILMARLLLPEHFGVATLALFYLNLATQLRALGIDNALIHRKDADDETFASYFSLRILLIVASLGILAAFIPLLGRLHPDIPLLPMVLLGYMGISVFKGLNSVQMTILTKQMAFRHLATVDVMSSITMTVVGPLLAYSGMGVWSIVAEQGSGVFVRTVAIWLFYRVWRPKLGWDGKTVRWFVNYGSKLWAGSNLNFLLDRFDDWWIGTFLGDTPLGFYSRAYEFARYPRRVVANPVLSVFFPTFAKLQDDRLRLSRAFFRVTSLMIRAGGLFSLVFILAAPEFITLFLGERWLPMLLTFQLMIVYTLLDPLVTAVNNLLAATGHPGAIARVRLLQAFVFIPAVFALGLWLGIDGVAIAADLMMVAGGLMLFRYARRVVDFSLRTLWLWPLVALILGGGALLMLDPLWQQLRVEAVLVGKGIVATGVYGSVLWLMERKQLRLGWHMIWSLARPKTKTWES